MNDKNTSKQNGRWKQDWKRKVWDHYTQLYPKLNPTYSSSHIHNSALACTGELEMFSSLTLHSPAHLVGYPFETIHPNWPHLGHYWLHSGSHLQLQPLVSETQGVWQEQDQLGWMWLLATSVFKNHQSIALVKTRSSKWILAPMFQASITSHKPWEQLYC